MANLSTNYSNISEQGLSQEMIDKLGLDISLKYNPFNFQLGDLFALGARKNPKRNFLFVSKLIGKHISVQPEIPVISGRLLADLFYLKGEAVNNPFTQLSVQAIKGEVDANYAYQVTEANKHNLAEKTLFIGFAETATGLGHSVFNAFDQNNHFIHTTREKISELKSVFDFEEEHSHATSHSCYGLDNQFFEKFTNIVLVDDEVTTGNTAMNLIKSLNKYHPNKKYSVLSLLDWRQDSDLVRIEQQKKELGVPVDFISIVGGSVSYTNQQVPFKEHQKNPILGKCAYNEYYLGGLSRKGLSLQVDGGKYNNYCLFTGRFGLDSEDNRASKIYARELASKLGRFIQGKKVLVLGTGECMFLPSLIASELKQETGKDILYHSTTRSPIYIMNKEDYPIQSGFKYLFSNGGETVDYFVYNVNVDKFDEVIMFGEVQMNTAEVAYLRQKFEEQGVKNFKYVLV